jgi:xylan 1,4-beta-xylosidase
MGSPQNPMKQQYADLEAAGALQMLYQPTTIKLEDGKAGIQFQLPIHASSLLVIEGKTGS